MKNRHQVFISSTEEDLINERQKIIEVVLEMQNTPIGVEMLRKNGNEEWSVIKNTIRQSDYYVLIIKHRYGALTSDGIGCVEKEYECAREAGITILPFIISDEVTPNKNEMDEEETTREKLKTFKERVHAENVEMCKFWSNIHEVCTMLKDVLQKLPDKITRQREGEKTMNGFTDLAAYSIEALRELQEKINAAFVKKHGDVYLAKNFLEHHQAQLFKIIQERTYIDVFERQVIIKPSGQESYMGTVTTITQIDFLNVEKDVKYYTASPHFMTKEQADSYKHTKFYINGKNHLQKIMSAMAIEKDRWQFPYVIKNTYPLSYDSKDITVLHETEYTIDLRDFYQSYQISFPCKTFLTTVIISGDLNRDFSILSTTASSYNAHTEAERTREYRGGNVDTIRLSRWALPGSGYAIRLLQNRK